MSADKLVIQGLVTSCRIGVTESERATPQHVWIDIELAIDAAKAARRDDVRDAVDYATLVSVVKQRVEEKSYALLETVGEEVASLILQRFSTRRVLVRVKKRALPGMDYAAVELERTATRGRRTRRVGALRRRSVAVSGR